MSKKKKKVIRKVYNRGLARSIMKSQLESNKIRRMWKGRNI